MLFIKGLNSFKSIQNKKIPHQFLKRLTNPQISHRWGSEVRNSPLVERIHTPRG